MRQNAIPPTVHGKRRPNAALGQPSRRSAWSSTPVTHAAAPAPLLGESDTQQQLHELLLSTGRHPRTHARGVQPHAQGNHPRNVTVRITQMRLLLRHGKRRSERPYALRNSAKKCQPTNQHQHQSILDYGAEAGRSKKPGSGQCTRLNPLDADTPSSHQIKKTPNQYKTKQNKN